MLVDSTFATPLRQRPLEQGADLVLHRVCGRVELITSATSLGGVETLLERRARYPGDADAGTPPTLIRLSVGIENVDDLWRDLEQALASLDD